MPTWPSLLLTITTLILATLTHADFGPRNQSTAHDTGLLGTWPTETYRSSPLIGLSLNYIQDSALCHDGLYTLLAPRGSNVRTPGPMIIDQDGHLVWTTTGYGVTHPFGVFSYKGEEYLGLGVENNGLKGFGDGAYYMLDSSYEEAYTIKGANGFPVDLREFHITRDETAVITAYQIKPADLRSVGGSQDGRIYDSIVQEIDIETGKLLFQWRASEHVDFTQVPRPQDEDARVYIDHQGEQAWDFFHINSIDKDGKGNFLVSSASTNSLSYIDKATGKILWNLGGQNNSFDDLSGGAATQFSGQHHARLHDGDISISFFDNNYNIANSPSRGLYLSLDTDQMTVQLLHSYIPPANIHSPQGGSLQFLPNGNILQGYGLTPAWTEFTTDGDVLCHVNFGAAVSFGEGKVLSDRVIKGPWTGLPKTSPDIALYGYEAAVSWNGATTVATYVLEGTNDPELDKKQATYDRDHPTRDPKDKKKPEEFVFLTATPKSGFETILPIPSDNTYAYLRILALNCSGQVIGITKLTHWDPSADQPIVGTGGPASAASDLRPVGYFTAGCLVAVILAVGMWALRRRIAARRVYGRLKGRSRGRDIEDDGEDDDDDSHYGGGDGGGWDDGDEELSDGELIEAVEFSLLGGKALRARGVRGLEDSDSDEKMGKG